jgi:acylphosphatase
MKRLTAFVSGKVQKTGYRARVIDFARMLRLRGTVENLDDGRVKIIAEGDEDKLKWFEEAIDIKNALIQVSSIEREYSAPSRDFSKFYKLVDKGETDSRLDTAAFHLKDLIAAVNNMNDNLGGKIAQMNDNLGGQIGRMNDNLGGQIEQMNDNLGGKIAQMNDNLSGQIGRMNDNLGGQIEQMNDNLSGKMDVMIDLQRDTLNGQEDLLEEVRESRKDLKGYLDQRFEKLESEVTEMRTALKAKGII